MKQVLMTVALAVATLVTACGPPDDATEGTDAGQEAAEPGRMPMGEGMAAVNRRMVGGEPGDAPDLFDVNFDGYASTAELLNDTDTWFAVEDKATHLIDLVDTQPAGSGHSKAMRYHYNHGANGCGSITIGRALRFAPRKEVWAEFLFRYSTNFSTNNSACYPNDHKFIFGDTEAGLNGRWDFRIGTFGDNNTRHRVTVSRPSPYRGETLEANHGVKLAEAYWTSDRWLTARFHIKASTTATSDDGVFRIWLTDPDTGEIKLIHELTGFSINDAEGGDDRIEGFSFCHNKDNGPANTDMYIWWAHIKVWSDANPPSWAE